MSAEEQIAHLTTVASERGWTVVKVFTDRPATVKKDRRPGELALIDAIRSGDVGRVLIFGIDRVGRSLTDLVTFMEVCRTAGVSLWLDEQRSDTAGCHCAVVARYSRLPLRVAALRRNSREIVEAVRPSRRPTSRMEQPCTRRSAISSRSANERYRPDSGFADGRNIAGGMPPASRNNLVPTACDIPTWTAASSLAIPAAIAAQNRRRSSRPATTGRPGENNGARPDRSERRLRLVIATPPSTCCDDHLSPASIPRSSSVAAVVMQACAHRWARSATRTTTRCARVSSRPSSASCSIGVGSRHRPKHVVRSSNSSRASTIHAAAIPRSDISHRSTTSGGIMQQQSIPTHTSLPPCSRPSRTSPLGGPK